MPWYAKVLAAGVVAYAFSPIDLIPDFVPVLGYVDDLIIVPLGVLLARRLVPPTVLDECRERAAAATKPVSWIGAAIVVSMWLGALGLAAWWWLASRAAH